jgi:hypothetical protein
MADNLCNGAIVSKNRIFRLFRDATCVKRVFQNSLDRAKTPGKAGISGAGKTAKVELSESSVIPV